MKLLAYITVSSLLLFGVSGMVENLQLHYSEQVACEMTCCGAGVDGEHNKQADQNCHKEQDNARGHQCGSGCACDCCFHGTALVYTFYQIAVTAPEVHYFGSYRNSYHFDYAAPVFEPPKLG